MGNDELEWETSTQNNIGIDARFFNNRLSFSVDYFVKKTDGLLISSVVPSLIVGGTASPLNASTLSNKVTYLHPSITRLSGYSFANHTVSAFEQGYLRKASINNMRLYVSLEDFFTFTSYPGMDSEVSAGTGSAQGIDVGSYPVSKKVVAGVNITF